MTVADWRLRTTSAPPPLPFTLVCVDADDVTAHLYQAHGRGVMDLPAGAGCHDALHRWEHVEAALGMLEVSHHHLPPAASMDRRPVAPRVSDVA